jgi:hypothetical protein
MALFCPQETPPVCEGVVREESTQLKVKDFNVSGDLTWGQIRKQQEKRSKRRVIGKILKN